MVNKNMTYWVSHKIRPIPKISKIVVFFKFTSLIITKLIGSNFFHIDNGASFLGNSPCAISWNNMWAVGWLTWQKYRLCCGKMATGLDWWWRKVGTRRVAGTASAAWRHNSASPPHTLPLRNNNPQTSHIYSLLFFLKCWFLMLVRQELSCCLAKTRFDMMQRFIQHDNKRNEELCRARAPCCPVVAPRLFWKLIWFGMRVKITEWHTTHTFSTQYAQEKKIVRGQNLLPKQITNMWP